MTRPLNRDERCALRRWIAASNRYQEWGAKWLTGRESDTHVALLDAMVSKAVQAYAACKKLGFDPLGFVEHEWVDYVHGADHPDQVSTCAGKFVRWKEKK